MIKNNFSITKIDDLSWALIYRFVIMISGVLIISILPFKTTPEEQGLYYALLGLISIYVVVDLGLSSMLINFISHQTMSGKDDHQIEIKKANLALLLRFAIKWVVVSSLLLGFFVYHVGHDILSEYKTVFMGLEQVVMLVCLVSIMTLILFAGSAVLEGLNKVSEAFFIKTIYVTVMIVMQIILLFMDMSYFALLAGQGIALVLAGVIYLKRNLASLLELILYSTEYANVSIVNQVIPFQLKVAISWVFGFLPIQIMPTILFTTLGPVWAGKIGLTQQIVTALSATSFIFIQVVVPKIGQLASLKKSKEVSVIYKKALKKSLLFSVVSILIVALSVEILTKYQRDIADRLLPTALLLVYLLIILINWLTFARAVLARAFHKEIILFPAILSGFISISIFYNAQVLGYSLTIILHVLNLLLCNIIIGGYLFKRFKLSKGLV